MAATQRCITTGVSVFAILAAAVVICFVISSKIESSLAYLRSNGNDDLQRQSSHRRRLFGSLFKLADPKSVMLRSDDSNEKAYAYHLLRTDSAQEDEHAAERARMNCQFVFVIGVEGSMIHYGFTPIIKNLAKLQKDPATGRPYEFPNKMSLPRRTFRRAIFNAKGRPNQEEVLKTMSTICPNDGKKRVYIEGQSWPSGLTNRPHGWETMTPLEISMTDTAMNSPTNLYDLMESYSPYADIKFVVLHRPYLATVASHKRWDGGAIGHSNVLRAHMLLLREFLDSYMYYEDQTNSKLWTVLCTEQIMSKNYETNEQLIEARQNVIGHLTKFLGWQNGECTKCFKGWRESVKDPVEELGMETVGVLYTHMKSLVGTWPPRDDAMQMQVDPTQCRL